MITKIDVGANLARMRITFVAPTVNMSGGIKVIVIYAQQLMQMGHDVWIVSPPPLRRSLGRRILSWIKSPSWRSNSYDLGSHLDGSGVNHHILDRWRPVVDDDIRNADVVVATWWETAEWVNALGGCKGAKVYFIQHHEIFPNLPITRVRATYRMPLHKIVVARWLQRVMHHEYLDPVVDCVPNSVDRRQFFSPIRGKQKFPTVGFLYHSSVAKGLDLVLEAVRRLRSRFPDLRLISFGAERPVDSLPLPDGTEFFFNPPQGEIRDLYSRCDVWVTASRTEGFNLPALEAMACRTPVVSTATGWPEEAITTGINGALVGLDDIPGLVEGLSMVLSRSDEDWRVMSLNAFETAASTSWEQSSVMFERALRHACLRNQRAEIERQTSPS